MGGDLTTLGSDLNGRRQVSLEENPLLSLHISCPNTDTGLELLQPLCDPEVKDNLLMRVGRKMKKPLPLPRLLPGYLLTSCFPVDVHRPDKCTD